MMIAAVVGGLLLLILLVLFVWWLRSFFSPAPKSYSCGTLSFTECKEEGCMYHTHTHKCFLPAPREVVRERALAFPYKLVVVGEPGVGKTTCINSMLKTFGAADRISTSLVDPSEKYKRVFMSQVEVFDTPGVEFLGDSAAYFKTRKFVGGLRTGQNLNKEPVGWLADRSNAAHRVVVVLKSTDAVSKGWLWNSMNSEAISNWTKTLDKIDTLSPVAPLILLNTYNQKAKTVKKVRQALSYAYRTNARSVHTLNCKTVKPLQLSKLLHSVLEEGRVQVGYERKARDVGHDSADRI
eukprot:NODE_1960_length_1324_cov_32.490393_g1863_i0.p1 GENE.NODE_1960_length_1324_cov_32.490393_g1863_i0~~NODE_1960_length_1324_cov_32.490393_g1863_i0.p1  ORF type:complete len:295 (+),score=82.51 NODE_1960_length_1324_cov_32.490393_g1863_i0:309-1193(+)